MSRIIILILIVASCISNFRCAADSINSVADSAYLNADYATALKLYQTEISEKGTGADMLYNLGNCYYRSGNLPRAILAYERALRIDPSHEKARINLEFVNDRLVDRPGAYGTFMSRAADDVTKMMSSNAWAWWGMGFIALFIGCCFLYVFADKIILRKGGFFCGILFFLLGIFNIYESFRAHGVSQSDDECIITAKSVILSTSPRNPINRNEEAMLLHEGTKLYIQDSVVVGRDSVKTIWYDVMVDNDHRAWIANTEVEKI